MFQVSSFNFFAVEALGMANSPCASKSIIHEADCFASSFDSLTCFSK